MAERFRKMTSEMPFDKDPPIERILDTIFQIASGNLSVVCEITGQDEQIDAIITGLNRLAETLSKKNKESKQLHAALIISERKHKTLFETSKDAIMTLNPPDWKFTRGNPSTVKMFGVRDEKEFISLGPWEVSPKYQPDGQLSSDKAQEMIGLALKNGSHFFEWQHKKYNGPEFPATVLLSRIEESDDVYLQATVRDISDWKKIEEELIKARNKAQESDRLKDAFLSSISHEIRTPLNHISMGMEMIRKSMGELSNEQADYFGIMKSSEKSLLNLLNDIIDISMINECQLKLHESECSLDQLMDDLFKSFSTVIKTKKPELNLILEKTDIADIRIDQERLKQVLSNLLNNAIKFSEKGDIKMGYAARDLNTLELYVEDQGPGISIDEQAIIFKKFMQLDNRVERQYGGLGLGLPISKSLVSLMGGKINVHSQKGVGSRFSFTLPYQKSAHIQSTAKQQKPLKQNTACKTVLIAEDDMITCSILKAYLRKHGYEVMHAKNGAAAVETASDSHLGVILMDMNMPKMDGMEATRQIKKINSSIPVIAMTGMAMKGDKERFLEAGCDYYISKPAKPSAVLEMIKKALSREI